jgi:hypothetical protein
MKNIYGNGKLAKTTPAPNRYIDTQLTIDLQSQKRIKDMLDQKYLLALDNRAAKDVLTFIIARTFSFNKVKEIISISQIADGVYAKRGDGTNDMICRGTGLSRSSIFRALKLLENRGYITREENRYSHTGSQLANTYGVNIAFFNNEISKFYKENKVKSKKPKSTPGERVSNNPKLNEALPEDFQSPKTSNNDDNEGLQRVSWVTQEGVMGDYPITTSINILEINNHSKENISNFSNCISLPEYKKLYELKYKQYFPGKFVSFTNKQHGQHKHYFDKLSSIDYLNIPEFLDYCFSNWDYIVKNKLGFLENHSKSDLPSSANINILLKFIPKFLEGFRETEEEFTPKYGDALQFRIKQLTRQGYSVDLATKTAVAEHEYAKDKKQGLDAKIEQVENMNEEKLVQVSMAYKQEIDKLKREKEKLELELKKEKNKDVLNFNMNSLRADEIH